MRSKGNIYKLFSFQWISKITSEMQAPYKPNNSTCMYFFLFLNTVTIVYQGIIIIIKWLQKEIFTDITEGNYCTVLFFCKSVHNNPVVSII